MGRERRKGGREGGRARWAGAREREEGRLREGKEVQTRERKRVEATEKGREGGREGGTHRKNASKSAVSVGCFRVVPAREIIMSLRYSFMVSVIIFWGEREGGG